MTTDRDKEVAWERLQERLPGGPGDPCLDCDLDNDEYDPCLRCKYHNGRGRK